MTVRKMILRNEARLAAIVLVTLLAATALTITSIHASATSWTVNIDADSMGPTDASVQSSQNILGLTTINIGAVVNASAAQPINNVKGWQFAIIYENTSLTPGEIQYGAQSGSGNPNWAGLVSAGSAFVGHSIRPVNASSCGCDSATHAELIVYFTVLGSTSAVNISTVVSPTVQGNLLASVSFTVVKPSTVGTRFTPTDIIFVDGNGTSVPNINPGPTIVDVANPPATATSTVYILVGIAAAVIAAIAVMVVVRRRRRKATPSKSEKLSRPVRMF